MIEATTFNEDWFYGTDIKTLREDKINIGVFNPGSIECMFGNPDLELHLIYIEASDKTRLLRNLKNDERSYDNFLLPHQSFHRRNRY